MLPMGCVEKGDELVLRSICLPYPTQLYNDNPPTLSVHARKELRKLSGGSICTMP